MITDYIRFIARFQPECLSFVRRLPFATLPAVNTGDTIDSEIHQAAPLNTINREFVIDVLHASLMSKLEFHGIYHCALACMLQCYNNRIDALEMPTTV